LAARASASQLPRVDVRFAQAVSPLRGCAGLAALAITKIHCRRPALNFQKGSAHGGTVYPAVREGKGKKRMMNDETGERR